MRFFFALLGLAVAVGGGVLFLQGLNILTGTPQSGRWQWLIVGPLVLLLGISMFVGNVRNKKKPAPSGRRRTTR